MCLWNPQIAIYLKRDYFIFAFTLRFFWSSTLFSPPVRAPLQPEFETVHQQNIFYRKTPKRLRNGPTSKRSVHARFSINWSSVQVILTNRSSFISTWWGSEVCVFKFMRKIFSVSFISTWAASKIKFQSTLRHLKSYWQRHRKNSDNLYQGLKYGLTLGAESSEGYQAGLFHLQPALLPGTCGSSFITF